MDMRLPPYAEFRFAFHVRDLDASLRFYQEQLGFLPLGEWDGPDGRVVLLNAAFGGVLEISGPASGRQAQPRPDYAGVHLAVRLETPAAVDEAYRNMRAAGVKLEGPPRDDPWGRRFFIARDPDGLAVHLYAELTAPQQDPPGLAR